MRKKIIRNTTCIVTAAILLIFFAVTVLMYIHTVDLLKTGTENEARSLKAAIDMEGLEFLEAGPVLQENRRITVVAEDGMVLYDSVADAVTMDNHKSRPEISEALFHESGSSMRTSDTLDERVYYYAVALKDGSILRVSSSMDSIFAMMLSMAPYMIILAVAIIVISILIIRYETRRMIQPINEINLDRPLEEPMYKEFMPLLNRIDRQNERIRVQMEELKVAEGMRREFSANVSHELKTPLTSMKVLADSLLSQEEVPPELYKEFMGDLSQEIERENKIINDLLSLVKMDKTANTMNITSENINALVERILKRLRPIAATRNIEVVFESFRPVTAEVDEVKLTLAISNLVENAIKYNKEDGWIHVSLNADHKYFYLEVADSGIGIPEESMEHIFERFYRVDKSHSREIGGTGLGLAIARSAVVMHRGAIKAYSQLGEGTTFAVRIPLTYVL